MTKAQGPRVFATLDAEAKAIRRKILPWIRAHAWDHEQDDVESVLLDWRKPSAAEWPWSHYVGHGANRIVFRSIMRPDVVLKVAFPGHEDDNLRESIVWDHVGPRTRATLVPLIEAHPRGLYNAMPLVKQGPQEKRGFLQVLQRPKEQYRDRLAALGVLDLTCANLDTEGRLLDYGEWGLTPRGTANRRGRFILTLKPGTLVYHGTSSTRQFDRLQGPAWVSRAKDIADWFAREWRDGQPAVGSRILTFRTTRPMRLEVLEDLDHMERLMEQLGDPVGTHEMAQAFCAARGVDGWIVRERYGPGKDDILLCETGALKYMRNEVRHAR